MWKNRKELPELIKLNLKFDIDKLKAEVQELDSKTWNACIGGELEELRQKWGRRLSKAVFNKDNKTIDAEGKKYQSIGYQQLSLTSFNPQFEIRKNRNSGTVWDKKFLGGKKQLDQRAYNILHYDIPPYMKEILLSLGPSLNRVGLAKLLPGEEIKPHRDFDPTFSARYHIAIYTNEKAVYNGTHIPADGSVWFTNTGKNHWVKNEGNEPRVHLIFNMDDQSLLEKYWN